MIQGYEFSSRNSTGSFMVYHSRTSKNSYSSLGARGPQRAKAAVGDSSPGKRRQPRNFVCLLKTLFRRANKVPSLDS